MRLLVLVICLIFTGAAGADPVDIALPALSGDYDSGFLLPNDAPRTRINSFTIPPEVTSIQDLQMVLSGTGEDGWEIIERDIGGWTILDTLSVVNQMRLLLTAPTLDGGCFWGFVHLSSSTIIEVSGVVNSCDHVDPLDPDLLLGTTVQAELICNFSPQGDVYLDALATVTEVHLVLNVQDVAAGRQTWGRIKALYR